MENLVIINNGQPVTNSLLVAEKFGKNHQHVLRDIDALKKDVSNFGQMFIESNYPDTYGREQRMYIMNRDGFSLLVMGFTGDKALQFKLEYIEAFSKMESMLQSDDYILMRSQEILQSKMKQLESKMHQQQEQLQEAQPKIDWFDQNQASKGIHTITACVEMLGVCADYMNKTLMQYKVIRKTGGEYTFSADYQGKGYGEQVPMTAGACSDGTPRTRLDLRYSEKGRLLIHDVFRHAANDGFIVKRRDGRWVLGSSYGYTKYRPPHIRPRAKKDENLSQTI